MPISSVTDTFNYYQPPLNAAEATNATAASPPKKPLKPGGLLDNWTEKLFGFTPKTPGAISIEELQEHGTRQLEEFNRDIRSLFRENGIDTSLPIQLGSQYGTGETIVTNNHPDKEKIEQLLRDNPEMSNDFKRIGNMLEMAELGRETSEFHKAYSQNPQQAVAQYAHLFNTNLTSTILLEDNRAQIQFQRTPKALMPNAIGYGLDYQNQVPGGLAFDSET